jgi:hypothetical protein
MDLHDENSIPILAKRLFDRYDSDALPFLISNYSTVIEFLRELHPHMSSAELDKARKILTLEVLAKFCHLAENFAAFAIAFKRRYQNEKDEILGIYNTIANYQVGQVIDFYKHIKNRDLQYIAHFMGYPPFPIQSAGTRKSIEKSCQNIKMIRYNQSLFYLIIILDKRFMNGLVETEKIS